MLVGSCELCSMNDLQVILKALQRERDDLHNQLMQVDRIIKRFRTGTYSDEPAPQEPKQLENKAPDKKIGAITNNSDVKIAILRALDVIGIACTLKQIQTEFTSMTGNKGNIREHVRTLQKTTLLKLMKLKSNDRGFLWVKTEWVEDGQLNDKHKPEGFDLLYKADNIIYE